MVIVANEFLECRKQVLKLLDNGWVRPSVSPYSAPVLFAQKKNGQLRMCIDYRALDASTVWDSGTIPQTGELLDKLQGARVYSSLDLHNGYHQIRLTPDTVPKTAFTSSVGHFE